MTNRLSFIFFIFFSCFLQSELLYSETSFRALENSYTRAENWLRNSSRTSDEIKQGSLILAKRYQKDSMFQEAIWTLYLGGHDDKAKTLEVKLEEIFNSSKLKLVQEYGSADGAIKYKVGRRNIYGIFKSGKGFEHETLAYKIDRALGLGMVPYTTEILGPNNEMGSIQYFVRGELKDGGIDFRFDHYPKKLAKLWLLDYLIGNRDRHHENWMKRNGGLILAIDHSRAINYYPGGSDNIELKEKYLPEDPLLEKLRGLDLKELGLNNEFIEFISKRRANILELASEVGAKSCKEALIN